MSPTKTCDFNHTCEEGFANFMCVEKMLKQIRTCFGFFADYLDRKSKGQAVIGQNDLLLGDLDEGDYDNVPSPRPLASAASHHSCNSSLSSIHSTSQSEATILYAKPLPKHHAHNQYRWAHSVKRLFFTSTRPGLNHFIRHLCVSMGRKVTFPFHKC